MLAFKNNIFDGKPKSRLPTNFLCLLEEKLSLRVENNRTASWARQNSAKKQ